MTLSKISFTPDQNIETKVNYLVNYFELLHVHLGKYAIWDFDNLHSLVDKLIFQIEKNPQYRVNYLDHHLKSDLFASNELTENFKYFRWSKPLIIEYLDLKKGKNEWIQKTPKFLRYLKRLRQELSNDLVDKSVALLIKYLLCKCPLSDHKGHFDYLTRIILSELKFLDKYDRGIGTLMSNLMTSNEKTFPLPDSILSKKGKKEFAAMAKKFFKHRTFKQQFEGIKNFKNKKNLPGHFLLRIFRLNLPEDFVLKLSECSIYNPKNKIFDKLKNKKKTHYGWEGYCDESNISIAVIQGNLSNYDANLIRCTDVVIDNIKYLNKILKRNSFVDIYQSRATVDFVNIGGGFSSDLTERKLRQSDLSKLSKFNLDNAKAKLVSQWEDKDRHFILASGSNEIASYWHYLECLIPKKKKSSFVYTNQIKDLGAKILLVDYKANYGTHLALILFNLMHGSFENLISAKTANELGSNWSNYRIVKKAKQFRKHSIIHEVIKIYEFRNSNLELKKAYNYFKGILHELSEIRNAYIHGGKKNKFAEQKLSLVAPYLIERIRNSLFNEVSHSKSNSIESLILNHAKKAVKLLNK